MLRGAKILLRTVREADLDILLELMSDVQNRGDYYPIYLTSEAAFKKEFHETGFWKDGEGKLLICDLEGRIVGLMFVDREPSYFNGLELGYILYDEKSRGKGYVTEAVNLLIRHLFSTRTINRIQILVLPANIASKRVAEKCGFKFEGIARGAFFHNGKNMDVEMYSILRDDVNLLQEQAA